MVIMLNEINAKITAMESARAANAAEAASIIADGKAAAAGLKGDYLKKRHSDLQIAEVDVILAELRCIAMLPALDAQDLIDRIAGGWAGASDTPYYNDAALARKAELESLIETEFA